MWKTRGWRHNPRPRDFETLVMIGQLLPHAGAFTAWTLPTSYPKAFCRQQSHFFNSPEVIDGPLILHRVTHQGPCHPEPRSCVILEANQTVRRKRAHWAASCRHCLPITTDFSSLGKTQLGCRGKHEQGLLGNICFKKWTLSSVFSLAPGALTIFRAAWFACRIVTYRAKESQGAHGSSRAS